MTLTLEEFRSKAQAFLDENATLKSVAAPAMAPAEIVQECRKYQALLADAGLAGLTYPVEYGGQGLDKRYTEVWNEEAARYRLPIVPLAISHGMCLPVLNDFGTPEQRSRHQEALIRGEEIWCQMFSEPGAGSDVASLATSAVRDGEEWVLNGQKVWTSGAQYCDHGLCVARTDPSAPKHRGMSMFIVDLAAAGVEIRPLRQITGDSHFNEIFLTDVRVPDRNLIGQPGEGWNIAVAMLMYERVAIGAGGTGAMSGRVSTKRLIEEARQRGLNGDPVVRDALADLHIRERIGEFIGMRIRQAAEAGQVPGPEGSIAKLNAALLSMRTANLATELAGASGQAWDADNEELGGFWARSVVGAPAMGIAGGTNEVQRNIIGERVLGLPKEPDPYKGQPWESVPRS